MHLLVCFRSRKSLVSTVSLYLIAITGLIVLGKLGGSPWNYNQYYRISEVTGEPKNSIFLTMAYTMILGLIFYVFISFDRLRIYGQKITAEAGRNYSFTLYVTHFSFIYLIFGIVGKSITYFTFGKLKLYSKGKTTYSGLR